MSYSEINARIAACPNRVWTCDDPNTDPNSDSARLVSCGGGCLRTHFWNLNHLVEYTAKSENCGWVYGDGSERGALGFKGVIHANSGIYNTTLCMPNPFICGALGEPYPCCARNVFFDMNNDSNYEGLWRDYNCQKVSYTDCTDNKEHTFPRFVKWPSPAFADGDAQRWCAAGYGDGVPPINTSGYRKQFTPPVFAASLVFGDYTYQNAWVVSISWDTLIVPHYAYPRSNYEQPLIMRTYCQAVPGRCSEPEMFEERMIAIGDEPGCNPHSFVTGSDMQFPVPQDNPPPEEVWPVNRLRNALSVKIVFPNRDENSPPDLIAQDWWRAPHEVICYYRTGRADMHARWLAGFEGNACCRSSFNGIIDGKVGGPGQYWKLRDITDVTPGYSPDDPANLNPSVRKYAIFLPYERFSNASPTFEEDPDFWACFDSSFGFYSKCYRPLIELDIGSMCPMDGCVGFED